jgi:hypothetical protein
MGASASHAAHRGAKTSPTCSSQRRPVSGGRDIQGSKGFEGVGQVRWCWKPRDLLLYVFSFRCFLLFSLGGSVSDPLSDHSVTPSAGR